MPIKLILLFLLYCPMTVVYAHFVDTPKPKTLESNITEVTVFLQGAQVVRKAVTTLEMGTSEVVLSHISPNIDKQSIQVKGEGNFTILSVQHQINYLNEQRPNQNIDRISQQHEQVSKTYKQLQVELSVLENEQSLLQNNQIVGGANSGMKAADLRDLLNLQRSQMTETKLGMLSIQAKLKTMFDSLSRIERQLAELRDPKAKPTSEISIQVAANAPTTAHFIITYLVNEAAWFATYDIRAKDIASPISLQYKANVQQQSGEDWDKVKLHLSTGNPALGGTKPNLSPWLLRFGDTYTGSLYHKPPSYSYKAGLGTTGEITGKVIDATTGEAIPFVTVSMQVNGKTAAVQTDFDGHYLLKPIAAGNYDLNAAFIGYETQTVQQVIVRNSNTTYLDFELSEAMALLEEVQIVAYKTPRLSADETSAAGTVTQEFIQNSPERNVSSITAQSAGVVVRGSRAGEGDYLVDGLKVSDPATTNINHSPTHITFDIKLPYSIPNDGKTYTVDIMQYEVPATYRYHSTPKLDRDVFLTAEIQDWESLNLLKGEANLFFEGTFIGKSTLNPAQTNDTLLLSMGRDKSIVVERIKQKDYNKQTFLGNNRTETRRFDISIRNTKKQNISLLLEDQYPIATDKDMDISIETDDAAQRNETTGAVKWELDIAPSQEKKLWLKYAVKYPKHKRLVLE